MAINSDNMIREISQDEIARCAYDIWEREGRPDGRSTDHWIQAEAFLTRSGGQQQQQNTAENRSRKPSAPRTQAARGQSNGSRREKRVEVAA